MARPIHSMGLQVIASSRTPDPSKLPKPTQECKVLWRSWFKRDYKCGHRDSRRFRVSMFGMETKKLSQHEQCPQCFMEEVKKHTIFCALCGLPIMPGDGVALYDDDNDGIRENATHIDNFVIGCIRWECCPSGGFFSGYWTKQGFKSGLS